MHNSFGEVSHKFLKMLFKYSELDIHLYNIGQPEVNADKLMNIFTKAGSIKYIPSYNFSEDSDDKFIINYMNGLFHLEKYILEINPDIVIILYDDKTIKDYSDMIKNIKIKHSWTGLFVPYIPLEYKSPPIDIYNLECQGYITVNNWSLKEIKNVIPSQVPIYVVPHIVSDFNKINNKCEKTHISEIYEKIKNKYIIGFVNRNQSRKRLDLVIESFFLFNENIPDSILILKTEYTTNQIYKPIDIDSLKNHNNVIIIDNYLNNQDLNALYNMFDIMINATDGEGCGLTPLECALSGTLSIFPNHSAYKQFSKIIPNAMVSAYQVPYQYAHITNQYTTFSQGRTHLCIYYECEHIKELSTPMVSFQSIKSTIPTYILSKNNDLNDKYGFYNNIEQLLSKINYSLELQILITSDLETIRYILHWLTNNGTIKTIFQNRHRKCIKASSLEIDCGINCSTVGIINPQDICNKLLYYYTHKNEYNSDLEKLQEYIIENFSEKYVWNCFKTAIDGITLSNN